jgi:sugar transferase (PEP-CTERM system associated)
MRLQGLAIGPSVVVGMVVDIALCFIALLLAASTLTSRYMTLRTDVPELPLILLGAAVFALVMALMYAVFGLYRPKPISAIAASGRTFLALCLGGYLTALALRVVADRGYIEQLIPAAISYLVIGLLLSRGCYFVTSRVAALPKVLIIGTGEEAHSIAADLRTPGRATRNVVGFYEAGTGQPAAGIAVDGIPVFSRNMPLAELVARHHVREIIVAVQEQRGGGVPIDQLLDCRIRGVSVLDLAGFSERNKAEIRIDSLKGSWLVYGQGFMQGPVRRFLKRLSDIVASLVLLMLTAPLMLLTVIAIRLENPGPVLYRQPRVGLGGRIFMCLKFRSMRIDAESDGVARWAQKSDPRVTFVGAFIRKTRIDELPQLFSVLSGQMSLVGPRPERPSFVDQLKTCIPFYELRHSVKPGITGWAQVRYHYGGSLEDARRKHQFDLYYVKNNSLFLDILVLLETVSVVLFHEGQ